MTYKIPFYKPTPIDIDNKLLNSNENNFTQTLEMECCKAFKAKYALTTSSGANALHLALCALDIKRGDKIICSVNTFPSTPQSVRHFDAEPIFVDCQSNTYMIDVDKLAIVLEENKSKKLRAIIINSMGGMICDIEKLVELGKKYDAKIILDATDAMGSTYNGVELGASGVDMIIYSFAPNIHRDIVSGGILALNDEELHQRAIMLRSNGIANQLDKSSSQANYAYDVVDIGYDYAMNELSASVCLERLTALNIDIKRRNEIAKLYTQELKDVNHVNIISDSNEDNIVQFFIEIDKNRDHFASELASSGVEISLHYVPLHLSEYYRTKYSLKVFDFPVALGIYQKTMSLPIYRSMSDKDVYTVIDAIKSVSSRHMK